MWVHGLSLEACAVHPSSSWNALGQVAAALLFLFFGLQSSCVLIFLFTLSYLFLPHVFCCYSLYWTTCCSLCVLYTLLSVTSVLAPRTVEDVWTHSLPICRHMVAYGCRHLHTWAGLQWVQYTLPEWWLLA